MKLNLKVVAVLLIVCTLAFGVPTELDRHEMKLVQRTNLDRGTLNARELVYRKYVDKDGKETFVLACGSYTVCFFRVCITSEDCTKVLSGAVMCCFGL